MGLWMVDLDFQMFLKMKVFQQQIIVKGVSEKAKKTKKGSTSLGAPRCMTLKELASHGSKGRGKMG